MKYLLSIFTLVIFTSPGHGQSLLQWSETYDTQLPQYFSDHPQIEVEGDSLITVSGRCNAADGQSLLKIGYEMNGDTLFTIKFGLDSVNDNSIVDYEVDSTGNLYLLSTDKLEYYKSRILLQKYAPDGTLLWVRKIHNPADTSHSAAHLGLLSDTCLLIAGFKEYDYPAAAGHVVSTVSTPYLYAYNIEGDTLWERKIDESQEMYFFMHDIITRADTAYIFGVPYGIGYNLLKVTADMVTQPVVSLILHLGINQVEFTPDNNLLISSLGEYRLTKVQLNGQVLWRVFYGTNLPGTVAGDEIRALIQDSAGNIYLTGRHYGDQYGTASYSNADILTLKYDAHGQLMWQNRYEYLNNNADIANSISLRHGEVYVGGNSQANGISTAYDFVLLKMDADNGQNTGEYRYDEAGGDDAIASVYILDDKKVVITGLTANGSSYSQTTQMLGATFSVADLAIHEDVNIYPNPVSQGTALKLRNRGFTSYEILATDGRFVTSGKLEQRLDISISVQHLPSGTYILKLLNDGDVSYKKFVVSSDF